MSYGSATAGLPAEVSWGEREIRRLLNALRRPDVALADPLGKLLCEMLGVPTPVEAVTRLISATFAGQGYHGARLAQLLMKADIEGTLSQAGVASEMGLSLRQFFRYRARAIRLLSVRIRALLGEPGSAGNSLRTLAELVGETSPSTAIAIYELMEGEHDEEQLVRRMSSRVEGGGEIPDAWVEECPELWKPLARVIQARSFELNGDGRAALEQTERVRAKLRDEHPLKTRIEIELCLVDVLRAKHSHDAAAIHRLGRALRTLAADDREPLMRALLIEAEGCLRLGRISDASEIIRCVQRMARSNRDVRSMALVTLLSANHALMTGDLAAADELATGAFFALQEQRPDAAFCQMTIARARLPLGKRWSMLPDVVLRPERAWDRLGLEIIEARYLLRDAKFDAARESAERIYAISLEQGYTGLAAHAAATIAACMGLRGEDATEQRYYVEAWKYAAQTGDRLAGFDLFTMPVVRPKDLGPLLVDETFCNAIAERALHLGQSAPHELWAKAIAFANGVSSAREPAESILAEQRCSEGAFAAIGHDLTLTLPYERRERWLQRWNEIPRKKDACDGSQSHLIRRTAV